MATDDVAESWKKLMPRLGEIESKKGNNKYSVQIYGDEITQSKFTPTTVFEKWACVEVENAEIVPSEMAALEIPEGLYAVATHKGSMHQFQETMNYLMNKWLVQSKYVFDNRPQFELMDHRYLGPLNPDNEEDVYIPIRLKAT